MKYIKITEQFDYDEHDNCSVQTKYRISDKEIYSYDAYFGNQRDLKIYDENDMRILHYTCVAKQSKLSYSDNVTSDFLAILFEIFYI
jgi:hypothetical protein